MSFTPFVSTELNFLNDTTGSTLLNEVFKLNHKLTTLKAEIAQAEPKAKNTSYYWSPILTLAEYLGQLKVVLMAHIKRSEFPTEYLLNTIPGFFEQFFGAAQIFAALISFKVIFACFTTVCWRIEFMAKGAISTPVKKRLEVELKKVSLSAFKEILLLTIIASCLFSPQR